MTITKGIYRGIEMPTVPTETLTASISFECGGKSYTKMTAGSEKFFISYDDTDVYEDGAGWYDEDTDRWITVTADAEVSDDFYNWFMSAYDLWVYETEYSVKSSGLIATAEAIRAKTGGTGKIAWSNEKGFKTAVDAIPTGSGGGVPGGYTVTFMSGTAVHASLAVVSGGYINAPSQPEKEGYSFLGWVDSKGDGVAFPYYPTADVTLNANYLAATIIGFTGLTAAIGVLTLTDDGEGKGSYTTSTSGNYVSVSSPLDDMFPYNKIEEFEDSFGNVFVKFPKFWMKWVTNNSGVIDGWKISNVQVDSDYFVPDAFLKPDGSGEYNDYFALGKYEMSGSSAQGYSKSGKSCLVNITRAGGRSAARGYGSESNSYNGYQQEDIAMLTAYNFLCMMYYGTANIQNIYAGRTNTSSAANTGSCDGVDGLNGWNTSTSCVKMLGIENPYGNIYKWIDGIFFSSSTVYYQKLPTDFSDSTTAGATLGFSRPTSGGYVSALKHGTSDDTKSCVYASAASGSASTYYGDYMWTGGTVLAVGGDWNDASYAGLWFLDGSASASASYSSIGARLSYRPL